MVLRIFFVISLAISVSLGSAFTVRFVGPSGLAGGAAVVWCLGLGLIAGLIMGIILSKRMQQKTLVSFTVVVTMGAVTLITLLFLHHKERNEAADPSQPRKPTAIPASYNKLLSEQLQSSLLPMGMGIVKPVIQHNTSLFLYSRPDLEIFPTEVMPMDTITFIKRGTYVDIGTAPPYLFPEALKLDYNIFLLRVISISRFWIEVVVNKQTGQTAFIDRSAVEFLSWPDFFLGVFSVEPLSFENNPVRIKPLENASKAVVAKGSWQVIAVQGDWLQIVVRADDGTTKRGGYIRWRSGDNLAVAYSLLS